MYYRLDGDTIIEMEKVANDGSGTTERYVMAYDENGRPFSISYYSGLTDSTPDTYYYVLNLQGDVLQLRDSSNTIVANYTYDAWGKVLSVTDANGIAITDSKHIANVNPFRYRGYYYDVEIGFYYCNSRYYDPEIGRFINADVYTSTGTGFGGYNMFAYCQNNPVMRLDNSGTFWAAIFVIGFTTGVTLGLVLSPTSEDIKNDAKNHYSRNEKNNDDIDVEEVINTYDKQSESMDLYHENTNSKQGEEAQYNNKYLSPNGGHHEIIVCQPPYKSPYIVNEFVDENNMGTYNFAANYIPGAYHVSHLFLDMIPYYLYGNTATDDKGLLKWVIN